MRRTTLECAVLFKLCRATDIVDFVLGRFSQFYIAIAYSTLWKVQKIVFFALKSENMYLLMLVDVFIASF